jgi:hypothetical protein
MDFVVFAVMLIVIKPENSPLHLLGKIFFRGAAPWEQRRKTSILLWAVAMGLFFGGLCVVGFILQNNRH